MFLFVRLSLVCVVDDGVLYDIKEAVRWPGERNHGMERRGITSVGGNS